MTSEKDDLSQYDSPLVHLVVDVVVVSKRSERVGICCC